MLASRESPWTSTFLRFTLRIGTLPETERDSRGLAGRFCIMNVPSNEFIREWILTKTEFVSLSNH